MAVVVDFDFAFLLAALDFDLRAEVFRQAVHRRAELGRAAVGIGGLCAAVFALLRVEQRRIFGELPHERFAAARRELVFLDVVGGLALEVVAFEREDLNPMEEARGERRLVPG